MKNKIKLILVTALLSVMGLADVKAYTTSDLEAAGWTKVSTITDVENNFYLLVQTTHSTVIGLPDDGAYGTGKARYRELKNPFESLYEVWALEDNTTSYAIKRISDKKYIIPTLVNNEQETHYSAESTKSAFTFTYSGSTWKVQCVSVEGDNYVGAWSNGDGSAGQGAYLDRESGNELNFDLYAISRQVFYTNNPNLTERINHATISDVAHTGWDLTGTAGTTKYESNVFESWNNVTTKLSQTVFDLPNGVYQITLQACYRPAGAIENGNPVSDEVLNTRRAKLFGNEKEVQILSIYTPSELYTSKPSDDTWQTATVGGTLYYYPRQINAESYAFNDGKFVNTLSDVVVYNHTLTLGMDKSSDPTGGELVGLNNFTLTLTDPYIESIAANFTSGNTMTAGYWYAYTVPTTATYTLTAGTAIGNIVYTTDGAQGASAPTTSTATSSMNLTKDDVIYFKSSSEQTLTLTANITLSDSEDNSSMLSTYDGKTVNITLTRTLNTGGWNTFAVPFAVADLTGTPLEGATLKVLESSSVSDGTLSMTFETASSIEAGKPYLVKVGSPVVNPTFSSMTISATAVPAETGYVDFIPTFGKTLLTGPSGDESNEKSVLYVGASNKLYTPTVVNDTENENSYLKGFRAFFQLHDEATNARDFIMNLDEENVTGVIGIKTSKHVQQADGVYYTIDGRRVGKKPQQKGIYILNGQKVCF